MRGRLFAVLGLMAGTVVVVVALAVLIGDGPVECPSKAAISAEWAGDRDEGRTSSPKPTNRQKLAKTLIDCDWFVGRSRSDITDILGRPDEGIGLWRYWDLGPDLGLPLNRERLELDYDGSDRVVSASISSG